MAIKLTAFKPKPPPRSASTHHNLGIAIDASKAQLSITLCRPRQSSSSLTLARLPRISRLALLLRLSLRMLKRLLKVRDDIVDMLRTNRDTNEILHVESAIYR